MDVLNPDRGERKFLFELYKYLTSAERTTDDNYNEFIAIPSDVAEKTAETLLMVINRMDGELD